MLSAAVLIALALLLYTYVGYPAAIAILARLSPRRVTPVPVANDQMPMVSVLLPVHNGSAFLVSKIESLLAQDYPPERIEILIYSDSSTDNTEAVARALAALPSAGGRIRVVAGAGKRGEPTRPNRLCAPAPGDPFLLHCVTPRLS